MSIRNGLLSTLRAKGRSALFVLLILVLTLALTLGVGMWGWSAQMLARFDESYTTVALLEYMGQDYPDPDAADAGARQALAELDQGALSAIEGVELWEQTDQTLAYLEGYNRRSGVIPYKDYGVVLTSTQFTGNYVFGSLYVPEEELPEKRTVVNIENGDVTVYAPGEEPYTAPVVFYNRGSEDRLWQIVRRENGAYQRVDWTGTVYFAALSCPMDADVDDVPYLLLDFVRRAAEESGGPLYEYYPTEDVHMFTGRYLNGYTGMIAQSLYSYEGKARVIANFLLGDTDFAPVGGRQYLLHGAFVEGSGSSARHFSVADFYEGCETPPYLEVSGPGDPAFTQGIFAEYARRYQVANNSVRLTASDGIEALEAFQQGTLYLEAGRFPEPGEAGVCVLDGQAAQAMDLGVGDRLELGLLWSEEDARYELTETEEVRALEIVGVTNPLTDYEGCVWVSAAEGGFAGPLFGYGLGRAVLDSRRAVQAAERIEALLPEQVQLTLFDQGYAAAAQPIETMRTTAMAVTLAAAAGAAAVLLLFALLFVGRQRETVQILTSLGAPAGQIRLWLLSGGAVIAGAAALAGAAAGQGLLGEVIRRSVEAARRLYAVDPRYSDAAIGLTRQAPEAGSAPAWCGPAMGGLVFLAAMGLCLLCLRQARRENTPRKGKQSVRVPRGGTSTAGRGPVRFALLSARRGGRRSAVVPAAAMALTLFLGVLASAAQGWSEQLDGLYDGAQLEGYVSSTSGRQATGLTVPTQAVRTLWDSGLLADQAVSVGWNYWQGKDMPEFAETEFGRDSRNAWIGRQPEIVALNRLDAAPEFFYTGRPEVTWLEGWDESVLSRGDYRPAQSMTVVMVGSDIADPEPPETYPVVAGSRFLEEQGLTLGDELTVTVLYPIIFYSGGSHVENRMELNVSLQIVGSFVSAGSKNNLYIPLAFFCNPEWVAGEGGPDIGDIEAAKSLTSVDREMVDLTVFANTSLSTCRFTLRSPRDLQAMRDYLSGQNFSQPGRLTRNRTTIILQDQTFVETVGGLGRYISFSRILFPVLFLVVGLLGFIISWLMINGRRMEFAVMRGLGASGGRVFASFFLEQGALCLAGCLAGALALTVIVREQAVWLAAGGFLLCYLAGCMLSVLLVGRTKLMALLSERE